MDNEAIILLGFLALLGLAAGVVYQASRVSALGIKLAHAEAKLATFDAIQYRLTGVEVGQTAVTKRVMALEDRATPTTPSELPKAATEFPAMDAPPPIVVAPPVIVAPPPIVIAWPPVFVEPPAVVSPAPPAPAPAPAPVIASVVEREPEPTRASLEERIGKRWTTWVGAVALTIAAGLFINLAAARGWLGPAARTGLAAAFGAALIVVGERKQAMRALSQGLLGGGVAIMYVAIYAGFGYYGVYGHGVGFAALLGVTVLGMLLALRHDASPIARLALLGGLLAPVLIADGHDRRDALFLYLVVLDLGVLAVASSKSWRALEVMALFGTWSLYSGWYVLYGAASGPAPTLGWLFVFHGIFVVLPFVRYLRRRMELDLVTFVKALSGALVGLGFSAHVLADRPHVLGGVAVALAGSYLAMGATVRMRIPTDTRASVGFFALVIGFSTLAVALLLGGHATTIGWAVEGPVLLVLGYHFASSHVRTVGAAVLALAVGHLVVDFDASPIGTPFLNVDAASGLIVAVALAAYAWIHHRRATLAQDRVLAQVTGIGAGALALVVGHLEIVTLFPDASSRGPELALVTAWWVIGTLGYLTAAHLLDSRASRASALCALIVAALVAVIAMNEVAPGSTPFANARVVMALVVAATGLLVAWNGGTLGRGLVFVVAVWVWAILGVEAGQQFTANAAVAVALTWTIDAVAVALVGRVRARPELQAFAGVAIASAACAVVVAIAETSAATAFLTPTFATVAAIVAVALVIARDLRRVPRFESFARALVTGALVLAWSGLGVDAYRRFPASAALAVATSWTIYALVLGLVGRLRARPVLQLAAGIAIASAASAAIAAFELPAGATVFANPRFAVLAVVVAVALAIARELRRARAYEGFARALVIGALVVAWGGLGAETYVHFPRAAQLALTIAWMIYAAALVAAGFITDQRQLRLSGLGLLAVLALKLPVIDLAEVDQLFRIGAFLVAGLAMIGVSYLYHRVDRRRVADQAT